MRGFRNEERERIREQLIEAARESLLTYGPEKTTVTDITEPVGIAKSTFYRFFDSKADIYLVILARELEQYAERTRAELAGVDDPREGLERFFRSYVEFAEGNPLVQQAVIRNNYREKFYDVPDEKLEAVQRDEMADFLPLIEDLKERSNGPLAELDTMTLFGLMGGSIGLLVLHRDEFEEYDGEFGEDEDEYYRRIQEVLISTLARGLTVEE